MSDLRHPTPECPDTTRLAAFIDGTLESSERPAIDRHLAECEDCYETFVEATRLNQELGATAAPAAMPAPRARPSAFGWRGAAMLAAAASILAVVWFRPFGIAFTTDQRAEAALAGLARSGAPERPGIGRLSAPFEWAPAPSPLRSAAPVREVSPDAEVVAARIRQLADRNRTAATRHAAGVAYLVRGEVASAVSNLEEAVDLSSGNTSARVDLAAAYLERWHRDKQAIDANNALDQVERVLLVTPADPGALFNRALALEALNIREQAIMAWQAVIDLEPGSQWATEAAAHIDGLKKLIGEPARVSHDLTDAEIAALAATRPGVLYDQLDQILVSWATSVKEQREVAMPALAKRIAGALTAAGRDAFRSDLVMAATAPPFTTSRRRCLASAIDGLSQARAAFQASAYSESQKLAMGSVEASSCAGVRSEGFEAEVVWNQFFTKDTGAQMAALAAGARLRTRAMAARYSQAAARLDYMQGRFDIDTAHFSDGLEAFDRARASAREAGDIGRLATTDVMMAEALRLAGEFAPAWEHHLEALGYLGELTHRDRHIVLSQAAITALKGNRPAAAHAFALALLANAEAWEHPAGFAGAHLQLARALAKLDQPDGARRELAALKSTLAQMTSVVDRSLYAGEADLTEGLIASTSDQLAAAAAFDAAISSFRDESLQSRIPEVLLAKGRALRAAGATEQAQTAFERGLATFEDQRLELRSDQLKTSRLSELWGLFGESIDLLRHDPIASLAMAERSRSRALLDSLGRDVQLLPLSPPELYSWLPPDTTALVYAVLPARLLIWQVTRDGVRLTQNEVAAPDLQRLVTAFVTDLRAGRPSATSDELARLLLPEGLPSGNDRTLVLLPDGPLFGVPFGALPYGQRRDPLVAQFIPVVAPSLTILRQTSQAVRPSTRKALVVGFGEASLSSGVSPLPEVAREVSEVSAIYPRTVTLVGDRATPSAILRELPNASIIHFAGHALADEIYPAESRLFVAPEAGRNALRPEEIARLRLQPGTIVVLSACDTARGRVLHGEGAMSLVRPFLAAGASAVVASLWPVRDADARRLLVTFHRELARGTVPVQAFTIAQRADSVTRQRSDIWGMQVFGR